MLTKSAMLDGLSKYTNKIKDSLGGGGGDVFTGATSSTPGVVGYVPAPAAGDNTKFLRGDGTWATVSGGGAQASGSFLNYSANTAGANVSISTNGNLVIGSAFNDAFTVTSSYNDIRPGTQGANTVSLCGSAKKNRVITAGVGSSNYNDVYIVDDASDNTIYSCSEANGSYHNIGGNAKRNRIEIASANGCNASIGGNASLNCIEFTAGKNRCQLSAPNNSVICGTGDDEIWFTEDGVPASSYIELTAGNNMCGFRPNSNIPTAIYDNPTIVCGTGNDSITFPAVNQGYVYNFSNNDTINFYGAGYASPLSGSTTVNGSTTQLKIKGSASSVLASVTLQNCTATQYHFQFRNYQGTINTTASGVYTVSGSQLVKKS